MISAAAAVYLPSVVVWAATVGVVIWRSASIGGRSDSDRGPVTGFGVLVPMMSAVLFPLVFFSFGALAIDPAERLISWMHVGDIQRGLVVLTADGVVTAVLIVVMAEAVAAAWFRTDTLD